MILSCDKRISEFIKIYKNSLPENLCKRIIKDSENLDWKKHSWSTHNYNQVTGSETDFDRAALSGVNSLFLHNICEKFCKDYALSLKGGQFLFNTLSTIQLNRYSIGTLMARHQDHINGLFDGQKKGIPILSIVGLLNSDFTGGEFIFWDDYKIKLTAGDLMIFPSNFIFQHRVDQVSEGIRYSVVTWAY